MTEKTEQFYVPRFEYTGYNYTFGGETVRDSVTATWAEAERRGIDLVSGNKVLLNRVSNRELYCNDVWVNFDDLHGKEIYPFDDAFIAYKPNGIGCYVWDKPMITQADWWGLNGGKKKLIEFKPVFSLYNAVPKKADEEKSKAESKAFDMIQNTLNEEERYTQNRFFKFNPITEIATFKTAVVFKTKPGYFDVLLMNGRYEFLLWYFILGSFEGERRARGLKWLQAYLQDVKTNRNAYMKSQYANHL